MKRAKGIVMRISGDQTVIVTSEGDFLEVPTPPEHPQVGQVIEVTLEPPKKSFYKRSVLKYAAIAAILILVLLTGLFNPLFRPDLAAAFVALDINDGVELYVNTDGKVIENRAVSKCANNLLEGLELQDQDIYQAVELIIQKAEAAGILDKDQNLVLASVVPVNEKGVNVVNEDKLSNIIREAMLGKKVSGFVMVGKTDNGVKQQAEKLGMTVNNYLVYDSCRKGGLDIRAEAFRSGDIKQVLQEANTSLPGLFPEQCFVVGQYGKVAPKSEKDTANAHGPNMGKNNAGVSGNTGHEIGGTSSGSGYPGHQGMPVEQEQSMNHSSDLGEQEQPSSEETSPQHLDTSNTQTNTGGYGNMGEQSGTGGAMSGAGHVQKGRD